MSLSQMDRSLSGGHIIAVAVAVAGNVAERLKRETLKRETEKNYFHL